MYTMLDGEYPPSGDGEDWLVGDEAHLPPVGEIIARLRERRGLSLRAVAQAADLSPSFLGAVERGESDIALGRLARLAAVFGHDVGSLLGYSTRRSRPDFLGPDARTSIDRGEGIRYEMLRIPGLQMELFWVDYEPGAEPAEELSHEGVDVMIVTKGTVTLRLNGATWAANEGDCVVWSGAYAHAVCNRSDKPASIITISTEPYY